MKFPIEFKDKKTFLQTYFFHIMHFCSIIIPFYVNYIQSPFLCRVIVSLNVGQLTMSKKAQKSRLSVSCLYRWWLVSFNVMAQQLDSIYRKPISTDPINTEIIEGAGHIPKVGKIRNHE